jgi:ribosome biogenesis GTPase A
MPKEDYDTLVRKMIKGSDVVVEVLDARFPSLSRSGRYERMVQRDPSKRLLIVMNKVDLVPDQVVKKWKGIFGREGFKVIPTSARERLSTSVLRNSILSAVKDDMFYITACFIGLPNTGKSSLINILKGRSSAPVAPIPGFTKALQALRITTRLKIYDTPGVVSKKLTMAQQILLGVAKPEKLSDPVKGAWSLVQSIDEINPNAIKKAYGIEYESPPEFLEKFAEKRHKRKKGGDLDLETAARVFLTEHNNKARIAVWEDPTDYLKKKEEKEEKES